ncbi:MAG: ImmA/IrrE family metallo-endopeptidase [Patescibacteria group bacterium]
MDWRRRRQIRQLADRVRDALKLEGPPYDVELAVKLLNGTIVAPTDWLTEALVRKNGESFIIEATKAASSERQRFSIAHELGHLFLHMGYLVDIDTWNSINEYRDSPMYRRGHSEEEFEANEFAAAFLMPESDFRKVAEEHKVGCSYRTTDIAQKFGVSMPAAQNRGKWIGLFDWNS